MLTLYSFSSVVNQTNNLNSSRLCPKCTILILNKGLAPYIGYTLDQLLHMDFWNTIEEITEQYFMKIRFAVLEILQEFRRTGRNVERKTRIF